MNFYRCRLQSSYLAYRIQTMYPSFRLQSQSDSPKNSHLQIRWCYDFGPFACSYHLLHLFTCLQVQLSCSLGSVVWVVFRSCLWNLRGFLAWLIFTTFLSPGFALPCSALIRYHTSFCSLNRSLCPMTINPHLAYRFVRLILPACVWPPGCPTILSVAKVFLFHLIKATCPSQSFTRSDVAYPAGSLQKLTEFSAVPWIFNSHWPIYPPENRNFSTYLLCVWLKLQVPSLKPYKFQRGLPRLR